MTAFLFALPGLTTDTALRQWKNAQAWRRSQSSWRTMWWQEFERQSVRKYCPSSPHDWLSQKHFFRLKSLGENTHRDGGQRLLDETSRNTGLENEKKRKEKRTKTETRKYGEMKTNKPSSPIASPHWATRGSKKSRRKVRRPPGFTTEAISRQTRGRWAPKAGHLSKTKRRFARTYRTREKLLTRR